MKILHLDSNHQLMVEQLSALGFDNELDFKSSREAIEEKIHLYDGIIIRSRIPIDRKLLEKASRLRFIGRVGAGLENIDTEYAMSRGISLFNAPEGNSNAVGEHAIGMLLVLMNRLLIADAEVRKGVWLREENRGYELEGRTVGIYGYGNMGRSFARKLSGFDCEVICYDIRPDLGDAYARQVSREEFMAKAEVVSLHTPQTPETLGLINAEFINTVKHDFWFINTARGKSVVTADLVAALESGKVRGAALDVLEYEKSSFENMFSDDQLPEPLQYLLKSDRVILSPHIAGWTMESKRKLAQVIVDKISAHFKP